MVRAPFYDKNGMKKGAWSAEEDLRLRTYVEKFGHWNWREIPRFAGLRRCGKSCRLRWMNYLRPELKHGHFTEEEDSLIMKLHEEFGNRWSMIAANLHGRTDNEVKNHWHTHLKKVAKRNLKPDQGKEDSIITFQSDSTHSLEGEAESNRIDSPPNMILESSALSRTQSSDICLPSSISPSSCSISVLNNRIGLIDDFCRNSSFSPDVASISTSDYDIDFMDDVCVPPYFHIPESGIFAPNFSTGVMDDVCDLPLSQTLHEINQSSGDFWREPFVPENIYYQDGYPTILTS